MKLKILTIAAITALILGFPIHASPPAATSSSEASPSSAIDQIREAVREQVESRLDQITDRPVGIIGQVTNITNQIITILVDEQDFAITTTDATTYLRIPGRSQITREDIALEDFILIKGTQTGTQTTVNANEIQVIPQPNLPDRQALTGTITSRTSQEIQIQIDDQTYTLRPTATTPIRAHFDPDESLRITDLSQGDIITVVGDLSATANQITPRYIIRISSAPEEEAE